MREHYEVFKKAVMQNGGEPLLQHTKIEVIFDPDNVEHMEAARLLYFLKDPMPDKSSVIEHMDWCYRQEEYKIKRLALGIKFKLEPPFHDVRSMVVAKIVDWAMRLHQRKMGQKHEFIRLPKTAA